jgi:Flp pilus assembly protein TadD
MRRLFWIIFLLAAAFTGRAEETNVPFGTNTTSETTPSMRGSAGAEVRAVDPPSSSRVPVEVPPEARPPVDTETVEKMGMDGIAAFEKGNFEGAKEAYLRVLKVEPNNLAALVNLGSTEYRLGNSEEAERFLRRSLQIKPDNPTAWLNLGMVYLAREEPMRALAAMAQAVVHEPEDPVARNYLGVAAGRNRWFDAAESELRRAIELRPDYADAHFNLAVFCLERVPPATELARRHYREARRLGAEPDPLIEKALAK